MARCGCEPCQDAARVQRERHVELDAPLFVGLQVALLSDEGNESRVLQELAGVVASADDTFDKSVSALPAIPEALCFLLEI